MADRRAPAPRSGSGVRNRILWLLAIAWATLGADCLGGSPLPPHDPSVDPPTLSVTVNGIPDDMKGLLVLPPKGWVVNLTIQPGDLPLNPSLVGVFIESWYDGSSLQVPMTVAPGGTSAVGVVKTSLASGTWTVHAAAADVEVNFAEVDLDVAVRGFPAGAPPIGTGQILWFDFEADRDAVPGPDFAEDLEYFGLGSDADPALSALVEDAVVETVLDRVAEVYFDGNPAGLSVPDPVNVTFTADDPGPGSVTRVCVGGEDPSGGITLGSILIDPNNVQKASVECGTIPPTGIFPRELLVLAGQADFQQTFDGLRPAVGGTPVGQDPLDAVVLDAAFDPGQATPEELARYDAIQTAIQRFGDALGTIVAHESGHALGLVQPGTPGGGLFGGSSGAEFTHNVTPAGVSPAQNFLMNAGNTFSFAKLAGISGQPLAVLRPINHAYLRDRIVQDPAVKELVMGPALASVTPAQIAFGATVQLTVQGSDFRPTPALRLQKPGFTYQVLNESLGAGGALTGWVVSAQTLPGVYDLVLTNPDGQWDVLPAAVAIQ
jgi:hypothetical protein